MTVYHLTRCFDAPQLGPRKLMAVWGVARGEKTGPGDGSGELQHLAEQWEAGAPGGRSCMLPRRSDRWLRCS